MMDGNYRQHHRNKNDFDRTIEKRLPPKYRDGHAILREVNKLEVVLGKGHNAVAVPGRKNWFSGNYLTGQC